MKAALNVTFFFLGIIISLYVVGLPDWLFTLLFSIMFLFTWIVTKLSLNNKNATGIHWEVLHEFSNFWSAFAFGVIPIVIIGTFAGTDTLKNLRSILLF